MTLIRTRPIRTTTPDALFDPFDRLFDLMSSSTPTRDTDTPMDLYETDDALVLELAVPGLTASDLDVSIEGRDLTIRADVATPDTEGRRYWTRTIPRGQTTRSLKLPNSVDVDRVEARVQDGLLILTMPKVNEAKVKKIEIQAN